MENVAQAIIIGSNIKRLRRQKKISQHQMAKRIGKSYSAVQKYEMGLATPPIATIKAIAAVLEVDYTELLDQTTSNQASMDFEGNTTKRERSRVNSLVDLYAEFEEDARIPEPLDDEKEMLRAYRAADKRAKRDALMILRANTRKD